MLLVDTHWKDLNEMHLMSTHNIHFQRNIEKKSLKPTCQGLELLIHVHVYGILQKMF